MQMFTHAMLAQAWKPERAHHDSMLGRCVLRMDHYWYGHASLQRSQGESHICVPTACM